MRKAERSLAEGLGRAHTALLKDLLELEKAADSRSGEAMPALRERLAGTQRHIREHFDFEEQNGYLDAVRKKEPRLERAIDLLAEEHRALSQTLAALIAKAGGTTLLDDPVRQSVRDWVEGVRRHELRENDLVQDAFNLDINAED